MFEFGTILRHHHRHHRHQQKGAHFILALSTIYIYFFCVSLRCYQIQISINEPATEALTEKKTNIFRAIKYATERYIHPSNKAISNISMIRAVVYCIGIWMVVLRLIGPSYWCAVLYDNDTTTTAQTIALRVLEIIAILLWIRKRIIIANSADAACDYKKRLNDEGIFWRLRYRLWCWCIVFAESSTRKLFRAMITTVKLNAYLYMLFMYANSVHKRWTALYSIWIP